VGFPELLNALRQPVEVLAKLRGIPDLVLVGGFLREAYYGRQTRDVDLAAPHPLEPILDELARVTGHQPFELNQRFSSYRVDTGDLLIDISPLHRDGVAADLARRDYTVNTLAVPIACLGGGIEEGDIASYPGSRADLEERWLRMVARSNLQ
jgi:tRNA nucleotidyltransferase/poly(A) polymerase